MTGIIEAGDTAPAITGLHGKAWKRDTTAVWERRGRQGPDPSLAVADWIVEAVYAHPLWHSYHLICYALRPHPSVQGETKIYLEGATHEMVLYALDPQKPRALNDVMHWLSPCNFAAQIKAHTDAEAMLRIYAAVEDIVAGRLSPDTDFRSMWARRFGDNMIKREWRGAPDGGAIITDGAVTTVIGTGAGVMRALDAAAPKPDPKDVH